MLQVPSSLPPFVSPKSLGVLTPCPDAGVAIVTTNAQAITKEAITFLTNVVFISAISFYLSFIILAFLGRSFLAVHRSTERKPARGYGESAAVFGHL